MFGYIISIRRMIPYLKKNFGMFSLGVVFVIITSLATMPVPYFTGQVIDLLSKKASLQIYKLLIIMLGLHLIRYLLSIVSQFIFNSVRVKMLNNIKTEMMTKILDMPMSFLNKNEKGYILARLAECHSIGSILNTNYIKCLFSVFELIFSVVIMLRINHIMTLIVLALTPIYFLFLKKSADNLEKQTKLTMESNALLSSEAFECLNNIEKIKISNTQDVHVDRFHSRVLDFGLRDIKLNKATIFFMENFMIISSICNLVILYVSCNFILKDIISLGVYIAISGYASKVLASVQSVANLGITLKPICVNIERVFEFMNSPLETSKNVCQIENITDIKFENVCFKYNEQKVVFDNFNCNISQGDKVFIKGKNGSGKTTFIKLIMALYNVDYGNIYMNNIKIADTDIKTLRSKISFIYKDIVMVDSTVMDNILYSNEGKTESDIENCLKKYNIEKLMDKFQHGLDTRINKDKSGLSLGQMQIISFLRGILVRKNVLVLDEPFANLDKDAKKIIIEALKNIDLADILIIISHDEDELDFANKVIYVDQ